MPTDSHGCFDYEDLFHSLQQDGHSAWAQSLRTACEDAVQSRQHGLLPDWLKLLPRIPIADQPSWYVHDGRVVLPLPTPEESDHGDDLHELLQQFCPWRKGPFQIGEIFIDTEWRSDFKWNRIADEVEWRERRVLDVGCGNGWFGWQMLNAGAASVVGLDPFLLFVMQHEIVRRLAGDPRNYVLPLTDACLTSRLQAFDITVSMGVLYHRTSPIDHLQMLRESLKPGGQLVLEALILQSDQPDVLVPQDRYAKMRNVWFIPSSSMLIRWLERVGFKEIRLVDVTPTTTDEQRRTEWMTFESLPDFLDPQDPTQTIEGYQSPVRAMLTAVAPGC